MVDVYNDSKAIKVGVDVLQHDQDRQRHCRIMDWISSADFPAQQSDLVGRRQEATGLWFLDSPEFTEWVGGLSSSSSPSPSPSQTLFCPGIPGAGKTMMAAIAVDHLQSTVQAHGVGVVYAYCNYKGRADQTASSLLAAILKQLVQGRPSIAEPLYSMHNRHEIEKTRPSLEEILGALQSVLTHYQRVYVVIDALDECVHDVRDELLGKLRHVQSKTDVRVMTTSRFIPDIVEQFSGMPELEVRANAADVKQYVVGQTRRLPRCIQRDSKLQQLVQDEIVKAVDGMFLLARLHVDSLLDKDTKKKVRSALDHLSRGTDPLREAYDGAIERIEGQLPGRAARAKSRDESELDEDNIPDVEELVSVCAGLVTVDEESNVIRLVHYTTQDYLEGIRETWNPEAQHEIAATCLTYLCFNKFTSGSCRSDAELESRLKQDLFLDYSAQHWGQHAATVQEEVSGLAMHLLKHDRLVDCAVQTAQVTSYKWGGYSQSFPQQVTGLHVAASFGLVKLSKQLLSWMAKESTVLADSKDNRSRTPLSLAAWGGHEAVVEMLAKRDDVDADSKDNDGRTPLSLAA
ncbi:hypothetical protein BS50DRAFT_661069, partial [Corynespora cassiicola Philippines]